MPQLKISIKDTKPAEPQPVMELWLEDRPSISAVALRGMDANGRTWTIAYVKPSGIYLLDSIGPESNWPTDGDGRLQLIGRESE